MATGSVGGSLASAKSLPDSSTCGIKTNLMLRLRPEFALGSVEE